MITAVGGPALLWQLGGRLAHKCGAEMVPKLANTKRLDSKECKTTILKRREGMHQAVAVASGFLCKMAFADNFSNEDEI